MTAEAPPDATPDAETSDDVLLDAEDRHARSAANEALFAHLKAHGAVLFRKDSVFRVRIAGETLVDGERVRFCLVPPNGALMKAGKWKKTTPEQRLALLQERVNAGAVEAMAARVAAFLARAQALARELDLEAEPF
jgi:hypothetical protein